MITENLFTIPLSPPIGGLADWRIGGLADWRIGGLADWRIGGLAFPHDAVPPHFEQLQSVN